MKGLIFILGIFSLAVLGSYGVLSHAEEYLEAVQHPSR